MTQKHRFLPAACGLALVLLSSFIIFCNACIWVQGILSPSMPPSIAGYFPLISVTDEMEPDYGYGDLLLIRTTAGQEEFPAGTVVATASAPFTIYTHVAGSLPDSSLPFPAIGWMAGRIPHLGSVILFSRTPAGLLLFVALPLFWIVFELLKNNPEKPEESEET